MPEDGTNDNAQHQSQQPPVTPPVFEPITSQDQLNALLGDRLARERAKYGDYNDLKAKAARLDQIEAANKSAPTCSGLVIVVQFAPPTWDFWTNDQPKPPSGRLRNAISQDIGDSSASGHR